VFSEGLSSPAATIQGLLEVPTDGSGLAKGIEFAKSRNLHLPSTEAGPDLDQMAALILEGGRPGWLTDQCLKRVRVDRHSTDYDRAADWMWCRSMERNRLISQLRKQATNSLSSDPARAKRLSRAALLFASNDLHGYGHSFVQSMGKDSDFIKALGVSSSQADEIRQIGARFVVSVEQNADEEALAAELDRLIATDAKDLPESDYLAWLRHFESRWANAGELPALRESHARYLWRFCCLMRARSMSAPLAEATAVSKRLQSATPSVHGKRWLQEAITLPGPSPKDSGLKVVKVPDDTKPPR